MLSNACFLAKIRFDTAENELAKNLQTFANFAKSGPGPARGERGVQRAHGAPRGQREARRDGLETNVFS